MKEIILFADVNAYMNEISTNRIHVMKFLEKYSNISIMTPESFDEHKISSKTILFFYFIRPFSHPSVPKILPIIEKYIQHCFVYFYFEDFHHIDKIHSFCQRYQQKKFIISMKHSTYQQKFLELCPDYQISILHHYIDNRIFYPISIKDKPFDIILYGCLYPQIYPFRVRLYNLLRKSKQFRFKHVSMPGNYQQTENSIVGKKLASFIQQSYLGIATTSIHDFFTKKYQEIPMCGSMPVGPIPTEYSDIYNKDSMIVISESMTNHEILQKITIALSNKSLLYEKTLKLKKMVEDHFEMKKNLYSDFISLFES